MFAKIENNQVAEYPITEFDIRARFPNTSFTTDFSSGLPDGYVRVQPAGQPAEDALKVITQGQPALVDGVWTQVWVQTDKYTAEELAAQETNATEEKKQEVRDIRNSKLAKCDWTQLADAPVDKAVWATYRQALRDITAQEGFPWTITWPDAP
jgi:Phage tail assembly chaperone protein